MTGHYNTLGGVSNRRRRRLYVRAASGGSVLQQYRNGQLSITKAMFPMTSDERL